MCGMFMDGDRANGWKVGPSELGVEVAAGHFRTNAFNRFLYVYIVSYTAGCSIHLDVLYVIHSIMKL